MPKPKKKNEGILGILDESALRCAFWKVARICTLCTFASDVLWSMVPGVGCEFEARRIWKPSFQMKMFFVWHVVFFIRFWRARWLVDAWFQVQSPATWHRLELYIVFPNPLHISRCWMFSVVTFVQEFLCFQHLSTRHLLRYASGGARLQHLKLIPFWGEIPGNSSSYRRHGTFQMVLWFKFNWVWNKMLILLLLLLLLLRLNLKRMVTNTVVVH